MERSFEREIREHLAAYFGGETGLDDFKVWLAAETWDDADADPVATRLANQIKLVLAEHSGGFIDDAEMHDDPRGLLQHGEAVLLVQASPRARSDSSC